MTEQTIILITGANSGVGYATTQVLASYPNNHIIMGCRDLAKGQYALTEIQNTDPKGTISLLQLDVEDDTSISKAIDTVTQQFNRLDVLVSNAGTAAPGTSGRAQLSQIFSINVFGAMLVSEAFIPLLLKSHRPYLIQVSSGLGSVTHACDPQSPYYPAAWDEYRMSKAALNMMTIQMHKRLQERNVRVFAFCPGLVRSSLRGESEEAVSAGGQAGDPLESGRGILGIVLGERDGEAGGFINKDGRLAW
jgi:NAD(P)-dependent dehydrogenase (short-subunit alcohol dehydrogenase family)